jgi:aryl-alcohol dehydrogenase-like predicted oxidoreductase
VSELIVGTAQFGAAYGITNAAGRLADDDIATILGVAAEAGVRLFDTAPDYGDAQERLGRLNAAHPGVRYVSKFSLPPEGAAAPARLYQDTLDALRVPSLHGLLFHKPADLRDPRADAAWGALRAAREAGVVTRIGASIYDADDLTVVLDRFAGFDLLQVPASIVDRRLLDDPRIANLHGAGVEIHVRSAYLQGLLLVAPESVPPHLAALQPVVASLRTAAAEAGVSVAALALGHLARHPVVDAILVGATTAAELGETLRAWADAAETSAGIPDPGLPPEVVDPRGWPPRVAP